ncbi:MAG: hypothetical protein AMJ88_10960 [Anaerolineae bacterium SM23_ 63]|nr:MAG: hypothetical protein AMJ88_10960 [Anaerolineae bacterium SM23_ 63]
MLGSHWFENSANTQNSLFEFKAFWSAQALLEPKNRAFGLQIIWNIQTWHSSPSTGNKLKK